MVQRAELLNLVLTDLYGPRQLLRRGLLPPPWSSATTASCARATRSACPATSSCSPSPSTWPGTPPGRCTVLADYTQAPSGAGYALENRVVVSRVFPSLYRDSQVHRLAPFFRALRASLQGVAPPDAEDPRIVLLSPGPWSETAFEHAYLASHLGYPLVEGADLVVRDGRVWMRSLRRLERVDVILRRTDAWFCDPLELRAESKLGVPGPGRGGPPRRCVHSQHARQRSAREPRPAGLPAAAGQGAPRRAAPAPVGAHVVVWRRREAVATCWPTWRAW